MSDLHGTQTDFALVITAALLANAVTTPIWGKLADRFNKKVLVQLRIPLDRGKYSGYMGGVMAVGTAGGPLLGGFIVDSPLGWRWTFFVCVPLAVFACGGLVLLALLVLVEAKVEQPIIPLKIISERTSALAILASVAAGIAMFGSTTFLGQYFQVARGATPTEAVLLTLPMIAGVHGHPWPRPGHADAESGACGPTPSVRRRSAQPARLWPSSAQLAVQSASQSWAPCSVTGSASSPLTGWRLPVSLSRAVRPWWH